MLSLIQMFNKFLDWFKGLLSKFKGGQATPVATPAVEAPVEPSKPVSKDLTVPTGEATNGQPTTLLQYCANNGLINEMAAIAMFAQPGDTPEMTVARYRTKGASQAEIARDQAQANEVMTGPIAISSLSLEDKFYLWYLYTRHPGRRMAEVKAKLNGTRQEFDNALNEIGSSHAAEFQQKMANNFADNYVGPLR